MVQSKKYYVKEHLNTHVQVPSAGTKFKRSVGSDFLKFILPEDVVGWVNPFPAFAVYKRHGERRYRMQTGSSLESPLQLVPEL